MESKYGLIGKKLGHSFSVPIHNMLGNNDYILCEVAPEELCSFINAKKFCGINVTIPYKTDVMPWIDHISERAQKIGSVNTIVNKNGVLYGDNTDYFGFSYMAKKAGISFNNKKVVILGTGGTCLTAKAVCRDEGAREIIVVGRKEENNYSNLYLHYDADIIINTTPVGMYPNVEDSVINLNDFKKVYGVIDVIYNPICTNILLAAKKLGIRYTNGMPMLVAQAKLAHELFFDTKVEDSEIDRITNALEFEKKNIVFIGMPGSGKTTLATAIADKLSRKLCDTDEMIMDAKGCSIPEIFRDKGEEYFRNAETLQIKKASLYNGYVIATGGGAVLREENRKALMRNSLIIWLRADAEKLATEGRPLSKDLKTLKAMEKVRYPLYRECADITVDVDHSDTQKNIDIIEKKLFE
ncbi:MAG: AAA family ATPase [Clostridia bacterium]|nr:AAA family ATPase [Clostridia bacterium]